MSLSSLDRCSICGMLEAETERAEWAKRLRKLGYPLSATSRPANR